MRYEASEIEKANLRPGEDQELEDRISMLQNSEKIYETIEKAYGVLYDQSPSAMDGIRSSVRAVDEISGYSGEIAAIKGNITINSKHISDFSQKKLLP